MEIKPTTNIPKQKKETMVLVLKIGSPLVRSWMPNTVVYLTIDN